MLCHSLVTKNYYILTDCTGEKKVNKKTIAEVIVVLQPVYHNLFIRNYMITYITKCLNHLILKKYLRD